MSSPTKVVKVTVGNQNFEVMVYGPLKGDLVVTGEGIGIKSRPATMKEWLRFGIQTEYGSRLRQEGRRFYIEGDREMRDTISLVSSQLTKKFGGDEMMASVFHMYVLVPPTVTLEVLAAEVAAITGGTLV